jgi:hypothetical protein
MPAKAGTLGKPTAVITSASEETVATAEAARLFWDTSNSSVANNFANQEASTLSSLFKKIKLRMENLGISTFGSPTIKFDYHF